MIPLGAFYEKIAASSSDIYLDSVEVPTGFYAIIRTFLAWDNTSAVNTAIKLMVRNGGLWIPITRKLGAIAAGTPAEFNGEIKVPAGEILRAEYTSPTQSDVLQMAIYGELIQLVI